MEKQNDKPYTQEERNFILQPRDMTDFKIGLTVPSKLVPRNIKGGVLLVETTYRMNESVLI